MSKVTDFKRWTGNDGRRTPLQSRLLLSEAMESAEPPD
jgi:hypothetical protein